LTNPPWFEAYRPLIGLRANLVIDSDGNTSANSSEAGDSNASESNTSDSLTSDLDRQLLKHLRSISELIVTTGATFRAENLRPSKFATMLVLSRQRNEVDKPTNEQSQPIHFRSGIDATDLVANFMLENGMNSAVLECGPTVTKEFASRGKIDEFCVTIKHHGKEQASATEVQRLLAKFGFDSKSPELRHSDETHSYWAASKNQSKEAI
jgi:riboflavin biosynthesis pyrimidine reductase